MLEALMAHVWLVVKGAGIGFAVAAPVGPIGMLCIRTTLERGRVAGFAAGLGAALADAIFGAIGVLGITALSDVINAERFWLELFGGLGASSGVLQRWLELNDASVKWLMGILFVTILLFETFYRRWRIFLPREVREAMAR